MRYILFIATDPDGEEIDTTPDAWVEEYNASGVRLEGMPLRPPEEGKTVRRRNGEVLVSDGPYTETAEWVAGYDLIECADLDEAIEVASRHPMATRGRIEVRPVWPLELGPEFEAAPPAGDAPSSRFLALFRIDPAAEPYREDEDNIADWVMQGIENGLNHGGERLRPVEDATLVRIRGGEVLVTDGPYAEVAEWVNGVGFIDGDWQQAIEYVSAAPMARFGQVELREFWTDM